MESGFKRIIIHTYCKYNKGSGILDKIGSTSIWLFSTLRSSALIVKWYINYNDYSNDLLCPVNNRFGQFALCEGSKWSERVFLKASGK